MDIEEEEYMNREQVVFAHQLETQKDWLDKVIGLIDGPVYISLDLDALDPSIMPATGTPEPGGMDWYQLMDLLRRICETQQVVGF